MKSPHKHGNGAYEDWRVDGEIQQEEERLIMAGYKFLGWNPNFDTPEYKHCYNEAHNYSAISNGVKRLQHTPSGNDCTYWCIKCKIYWKVDMS